ncbi:tetratricopeptide repeat protein [Chryseobacterium sp. 22532]|uniref:tetratricopeptide repeat protein n=1 Tax=Chryseobacterium sp. 22532 TaxID=3453938 RepID=UPI003F86E9F5
MKSIFMFFFLFSFMGYSQSKEVKKIDSLLQLSSEYKFKDMLKVLSYTRQAVSIAEKINNNELIYKCYLEIADNLYTLNLNDKSLQYASKADKILPKKSKVQQARLNEIKIINFAALGLEELELETANKNLSILLTENSNKSKEIKARTFAYLANYYERKEDYEKANQFIDKTIKLNNEISDPKPIDTYIQKADILMKTQQWDSSFIYLQKAFDEYKSKKNQSSQYNLLWALGDYYYLSGKYLKALDSYRKSLEDMNKFKVVDIECAMSIKENIYRIYEALGDEKNKEKYYTEYQKDYAQYNKVNNKGLLKAVDLILDEKKGEDRIAKERAIKVAFIASGTFLILLIFLIYFYSRNKKMKKKKLKLVLQKDILIKEKQRLESEKISISKKANENQFNELFSLAKNNSPEFLILFEELYPNFVKNLKEINPKIRNSELYFCALAFLNFSTKEISHFTFVSVAAVQLRKYRIRKKYNISSEENFNIWMKALND